MTYTNDRDLAWRIPTLIRMPPFFRLAAISSDLLEVEPLAS